jgi:plastocyanin
MLYPTSSHQPRSRHWLGLLVGLALLGAALPSQSLAQDAGVTANIVEPSAGDPTSWGYDPSLLTIAAGQVVTWTNTGAQGHTVTADDGSFDSGNIAAGASASLEFDTPGTYTYYCTPHPWMKATITVTGG